MADFAIRIVLFGPLIVLAAVQLFAVRKLFSAHSMKVFLWGLAFSAVATPLLGLLGNVSFGPQDVDFVWAALRLMRIWLMLFGLAVLARLGAMAALYAWSRRPRAAA